MSSVMSVLQLDTQNLLGKYVLIYGLHLVRQDGGGYATSFEYMYDTTLPIIDYIAREKRQKIKVMGLGVGQHGVMFKGKAIAVDVFNSMNGTVLQVHHEEIIKFITLRLEPGTGQDAWAGQGALIEFVEAAKKYSVDMMDVYIGEKSKIRKYLYDIGHGGDWEFMHAAPKRKLDSIFLPRKEKDAIREFVRRFQSDEVRREYAHFNIPYKFNVMLYGVPGSGKSSTINAIASELNSDVAIMSFSSEITDTHMIRAMNRLMQLENCKVVVMEDIDCLFNGGRKEGDAHRNSVSLSGLLNILDGVSRAEGLVVCMTTNDIEAIDDAMLRAGRVDLTVKYGFATEDQVREMVEYYFPGAMGMDIDKFCGMIRYKNVTTSMLQQYFFELRGAPDQICASVDKLMGMRVDKASMKRDAEGCEATHSFYS